VRPIGTTAIDEGPRELGDSDEEKRERAIAELVLPELLASCMANVCQAPRQMSALAVESPLGHLAAASATSPGEVAESWRLRGGGMTAEKLITHIEAGDLGKISLVVERTVDGLKISLGVDNPLTAASAAMQRSALEQSLRASGLGVVRVIIARQSEDGTELAQSPYAPTTERWRKRLNLTG
jgi:hypothetical protein